MEVCDREYLFEEEVEVMVKAARKGRWGHRDSKLILMGVQKDKLIALLIA